jgi:hypothetical protein
MGAEGAKNDLHYSGAQFVRRLKPACKRISAHAICRGRLAGSRVAGIRLYRKCDGGAFCKAAWLPPPVYGRPVGDPGGGFPDRSPREQPSA